MTYVITAACVDVMDKSCIDVCPVDCIYEGARMLYIQPDDCVDCGACVPVCPQEAIEYDADLPDELREYEEINREFFLQSDPPAEPAGSGARGRDHPRVEELPVAPRRGAAAD